jgi:hypothetical protein
MEFVEGDAGVGQMFRNAFDKGLGHIDADAGDLLCLSLMLAQERGKPGDGASIAAFSDEHHFLAARYRTARYLSALCASASAAKVK